jgi:ubiquinone/menaquinone biosynthesis C-methylase UbiE
MELTQEQLEGAGYSLKAAPDDAWRNYDERNPIPGYFQFDWLSARHPDLYHKFALTSVGLLDELNKLVDLTGLEVVDIGAGTGRSTMGLATKAKRVIAIDIYESVAAYGKRLVQQAGLQNVIYVRGASANLPIRNDSMDACVRVWAEVNYREAFRVLKPNGYLIDLGPAPARIVGQLDSLLAEVDAEVYPEITTEIAPVDEMDPLNPASDSFISEETWNGVRVTPPILLHDFTYEADYGDYVEAAAIFGRLYGPKVKRFLLDQQKSTVSSRLRIVISRVKK